MGNNLYETPRNKNKWQTVKDAKKTQNNFFTSPEKAKLASLKERLKLKKNEKNTKQ